MIDQDLLEGNKYFKWYWSICNRAKDRVLSPDTYVEKHHIYPKSIYGQNKYLVKLTAKEHYIVHLLLWWGLRSKFGQDYKLTGKMGKAFSMMNPKSPDFKNQTYSSKNFEMFRQAYSESVTGKNHPQYGKEPTIETKEKISNANKGIKNGMYGKNPYDIWIEKYGKELADIKQLEINKKRSKTNKGKKQSSEHSKKIGKALKGKSKSKEHIQKMSESQKGFKNHGLTKYIIKTPDNNIIELISQQKVIDHFKGIINGVKILLYGEYKGYKLLNKIKVNR